MPNANITVTSAMVRNIAYSMVVSPEIKKPEDLRGKKLTVSRFGSNSDYATRKILLKWGLKPDVDLAILQIPGGQPTRLAAIQTKQSGLSRTGRLIIPGILSSCGRRPCAKRPFPGRRQK